MLSWANPFNIFCFLDNHDYSVRQHQFECVLAAGVSHSIKSTDLSELDVFLQKNKTWIFGHISYELKNSIHHIHSDKKNEIGFPLLYFFVPKVVCLLKKNTLTIYAEDPQEIFQQISNQVLFNTSQLSWVTIQQKLEKQEYLDKIIALQKHILQGDCYEINFCQEFFAENAVIDPLTIFQKLNTLSPNPFAAFYRHYDQYLMCASPERFLSKEKNTIISQPIKGTAKRNVADAKADEKLKDDLVKSQKERSENVMVVDMVRNDLSRICKEGTVQTDELFKVYTYPQVHQMISTVKGELLPDISFSEIITATFPMGSMTGAPKHRVMQLIDEYEEGSRGIFSGSVGYISPDGDFDFNVVIRSIMYNAAMKYLSYQVGSGITFYSDPEKEWEECNLKAEAIKKVLTPEPALSK